MKFTFGALISVVLLGIYVYLVNYGLLIIECETNLPCDEPKTTQFNQNMQAALAQIGGLISALIVAELGVTKPGEYPLARLVTFGNEINPIWSRVLKVVVVVYIAAWLYYGAKVFVVASLWNPDILPPLTDLGQAWLGIAVGAGYAYLGINRDKQK